MKKQNQNLFKFIIFIFFYLYLTLPIYGEVKFIKSIVKKVIVTDGDTIKIRNEKIRLFGIDAPEMKQICNDENDESLCMWSCIKKIS